MKKHYIKTKKAYSLPEILLSLAIVSILTTMLFNILIITIRVSYKSIARSFTREEISIAMSLISRDIRSADYVNDCGQGSLSESCEIIINGTKYLWEKCGPTDNLICKTQFNTDGTTSIVYRSSESLKLTTFEFIAGFVDNGASSSQQNILITIVGSYNNESLNINNVLRQQTASTRNYKL